jgi:hypothetical protein
MRQQPLPSSSPPPLYCADTTYPNSLLLLSLLDWTRASPDRPFRSQPRLIGHTVPPSPFEQTQALDTPARTTLRPTNRCSRAPCPSQPNKAHTAGHVMAHMQCCTCAQEPLGALLAAAGDAQNLYSHVQPCSTQAAPSSQEAAPSSQDAAMCACQACHFSDVHLHNSQRITVQDACSLNPCV